MTEEQCVLQSVRPLVTKTSGPLYSHNEPCLLFGFLWLRRPTRNSRNSVQTSCYVPTLPCGAADTQTHHTRRPCSVTVALSTRLPQGFGTHRARLAPSLTDPSAESFGSASLLPPLSLLPPPLLLPPSPPQRLSTTAQYYCHVRKVQSEEPVTRKPGEVALEPKMAHCTASECPCIVEISEPDALS